MVFLSLPMSSRPVFISTSACFASSLCSSSVLALYDLRSSLIFWPTSRDRSQGSDVASNQKRKVGSCSPFVR